MKSGFIAIVGRPSSGKSTLVNALCGAKVSIVSPVPQTTRNQVRGIVNAPDGQIVILDTPGFHLSDKKFNLEMMGNVSQALEGADAVLYVADLSRPAGPEELALQERLRRVSLPILAALNKADLAPQELSSFEAQIREALPQIQTCMAISALTGAGIESLKAALFAVLPEGESFYPADFYTDQDPSFRASEIIREAAIQRLGEEVPHALYVEIADMELKENGDRLWIRAFLTVERDSQIGIVVGHGGAKIKEIRVASQKQLGKIFTQRIELDLRVKVNAKWRTKDTLIRGLLKGQESSL
ncbi:MAG: GTPase Era [Spirochaetales bacterium]|nr:GTPase Era [Spirochaetales bacterium]